MDDAKDITLRPDAKGRVTLGKMAEGISSFRVHKEKSGRIVMVPFVEIPERERWLYENPEALAMVEEGLRQSARGETVRMGSFAKYANDDD